MLPNLDTYATALSIDRALTLKRAERRARLVGSADRSAATGQTMAWAITGERRDRLGQAIRSLGAALRPSHA